MNLLTRSRHRALKCWLLALGSLTTSLCAWGSDAALSPMQSVSPLKWTAMLVLITLMIAAVLWLLKRYSGASIASPRWMRIVAVTPLSTREKIMLVQVGQVYLLLGVTPTQITTLHTFDQMPDLGNLAQGASFAQKMQQMLKKTATSKSAGAPDPANPSPSQGNRP